MHYRACRRALVCFALLLPVTSLHAAEPSASSMAASDLMHREQLSGDWGGTRSAWNEQGVELDFALTQFYQGVADGGVRNDSEYNGVFVTDAKLDLGKLAGWKFWQVDFQTQTRFGGPLLGGTGTISPVNTAAIIPGTDDTVFAITALTVTKLIPIDLEQGNVLAIAAGRVNLIDAVQEQFFAGGGTERFMNIAQIGPLTVAREVPLITNALSFAYVRHGEPFITFTILDPNDHSTDAGVSALFDDGVSFSPGINFPTHYFGKSGMHSFGGAITTKDYTPFDTLRQLILPGPPRVPLEPESGSWSVNYLFRQYLIERAKDDGWGLFTQVAFANESTSPITRFFNIGLGGNGLLPNRRDDEFGVAYAYTDLSDDLKDDLDLLRVRGVRPEHQVEVFYNAHITPWFRLTGDLQVIRPTRKGVDTDVIPAMRLKVIF